MHQVLSFSEDMICPRLPELPPPPSGRTGWPWTEESERPAEAASKGQSWPRISVVTPSFNQGRFLEETIRSILLQGYPNLEYVIMDGGSADNSVDIIRKYSDWVNYWVSEPDSGQSDAINRGLKIASGDYATWINSDDLLAKNALVEHTLTHRFANDVIYVGDCIYIDGASRVVLFHRARIRSLEDLVRIDTVWYAGGHIVQPEVLFPRKLALKVGGLNPYNHYTMDYELWGKFFLAGASFHYTDIPFGMFRTHKDQKIADGLRTAESIISTAMQLTCAAERLSAKTKKEILVNLAAYREKYPRDYWRGTGRLATIGLPRIVVNSIRRVRAKLQKAMRGEISEIN
jgi:glycosyltransferase involved in cell wall biosynthesis